MLLAVVLRVFLRCLLGGAPVTKQVSSAGVSPSVKVVELLSATATLAGTSCMVHAGTSLGVLWGQGWDGMDLWPPALLSLLPLCQGVVFFPLHPSAPIHNSVQLSYQTLLCADGRTLGVVAPNLGSLVTSGLPS